MSREVKEVFMKNQKKSVKNSIGTIERSSHMPIPHSSLKHPPGPTNC